MDERGLLMRSAMRNLSLDDEEQVLELLNSFESIQLAAIGGGDNFLSELEGLDFEELHTLKILWHLFREAPRSDVKQIYALYYLHSYRVLEGRNDYIWSYGRQAGECYGFLLSESMISEMIETTLTDISKRVQNT